MTGKNQRAPKKQNQAYLVSARSQRPISLPTGWMPARIVVVVAIVVPGRPIPARIVVAVVAVVVPSRPVSARPIVPTPVISAVVRPIPPPIPP